MKVKRERTRQFREQLTGSVLEETHLRDAPGSTHNGWNVVGLEDAGDLSSGHVPRLELLFQEKH